MKNAQIYPFIRNNYFYGKLLTVRDFDTEQKYFNDKRRIINSLNFGSGIMCGLSVTKFDSKTIKIQPGAAIDGRGREIVMPSEITQPLSMFDGFKCENYNKNVYLCLAYDEKVKEPVQAVSDADSSGKIEYNRVNENFKFVIDEVQPEINNFNLNHLLYNIDSLYNENGVNIWKLVPRYINEKDTQEVKIIIEKPLNVGKIHIKFEALLDNLWSEDCRNRIEYNYEADDLFNKSHIELSYKLTAVGETSSKGIINMKHCEINISGEEDIPVKIINDKTYELDIIDEPLKNKITNDYYSQSLDKCLGQYGDLLYVAKICLVANDESYEIAAIDNVPFNQYVYNQKLVDFFYNSKADNTKEIKSLKPLTAQADFMALTAEAEPKVNVKFNETSNQLRFNFALPTIKKEKDKIQIASGITYIKLPQKAKANRCFYSDPIDHTLGPGVVCMEYALEENYDDLVDPKQQLIFGDLDVFEESDFIPSMPPVTIGILLDKQKGTFRVGIRLLETTKLDSIPVRWWAYKVDDQPPIIPMNEPIQPESDDEVQVYIEPSTVELKRGQQFQFKCIVKNTDNQIVTWRVVEKDGGKINQKGLYTAPDARGVYKIEATSVADFSKTATLFVVVKD